jgi:hypothetical protein
MSVTPPKHVFNVKVARIPRCNLKLKALPLIRAPLPAVVDLRPQLPTVFNQGNLGSCTANALVAAVAYDVPDLIGSRLFLYYNERQLENTIPDDSGALISDGVLSLEKYGLCPETQYPYIIEKFALKPPQECYVEARKHYVMTANNISNDLSSMKNSLASGFPFVVGILVYTTFESDSVAKSGLVPLPQPNEECLGGHAVLICGYDDNKQLWIARNSWGSDWGDKGYFYLPYAYLTNPELSSDLWNITAFKSEPIPVPVPAPKPAPHKHDTKKDKKKVKKDKKKDKKDKKKVKKDKKKVKKEQKKAMKLTKKLKHLGQ